MSGSHCRGKTGNSGKTTPAVAAPDARSIAPAAWAFGGDDNPFFGEEVLAKPRHGRISCFAKH